MTPDDLTIYAHSDDLPPTPTTPATPAQEECDWRMGLLGIVAYVVLALAAVLLHRAVSGGL